MKTSRGMWIGAALIVVAAACSSVDSAPSKEALLAELRDDPVFRSALVAALADDTAARAAFQGPPGPQGEVGPQGEPGDRGERGETGTGPTADTVAALVRDAPGLSDALGLLVGNVALEVGGDSGAFPTITSALDWLRDRRLASGGGRITVCVVGPTEEPGRLVVDHLDGGHLRIVGAAQGSCEALRDASEDELAELETARVRVDFPSILAGYAAVTVARGHRLGLMAHLSLYGDLDTPPDAGIVVFDAASLRLADVGIYDVGWGVESLWGSMISAWRVDITRARNACLFAHDFSMLGGQFVSCDGGGKGGGFFATGMAWLLVTNGSATNVKEPAFSASWGSGINRSASTVDPSVPAELHESHDITSEIYQ